jgi:hypothetical protein
MHGIIGLVTPKALPPCYVTRDHQSRRTKYDFGREVEF